MEQIWQDTMLRPLVGLLIVNVLARLALELSTRTFRPRAWADWLATQVVPWVLRAASVEVVLLVLPPEWAEVRALARGAVCLGVCSALVRHTVEALRDPA